MSNLLSGTIAKSLFQTQSLFQKLRIRVNHCASVLKLRGGRRRRERECPVKPAIRPIRIRRTFGLTTTGAIKILEDSSIVLNVAKHFFV